MPVAMTAAMAGALALGAYAGSVVLLVAVAGTQAVMVYGWHRALDVPGALGGAVLAGAAAGVADLFLVVRDDARPLAPLSGVLGLAVIGAFLHQLARRGKRAQLTGSLTATAALAVFAVLAGLYLAALQTRGEAALVALVAAAAFVAVLVARAPLPTMHRVGCAALGGALVGAIAAVLSDLEVGAAVLIGVVAAMTATGAHVFITRAPRPDLTTVAALPLVVAAPVAYVLGRLLVG